MDLHLITTQPWRKGAVYVGKSSPRRCLLITLYIRVVCVQIHRRRTPFLGRRIINDEKKHLVCLLISFNCKNVIVTKMLMPRQTERVNVLDKIRNNFIRGVSIKRVLYKYRKTMTHTKPGLPRSVCQSIDRSIDFSLRFLYQCSRNKLVDRNILEFIMLQQYNIE